MPIREKREAQRLLFHSLQFVILKSVHPTLRTHRCSFLSSFFLVSFSCLMASLDSNDLEKTDGVVADHLELSHAPTHESSGGQNVPVQHTETRVLEEQYRMSFRTYVVVACMGLTWGTATLANVGPSSTYSHAVAELGGESISSWIPNAALFPIIGLIPVWGRFRIGLERNGSSLPEESSASWEISWRGKTHSHRRHRPSTHWYGQFVTATGHPGEHGDCLGSKSKLCPRRDGGDQWTYGHHGSCRR